MWKWRTVLAIILICFAGSSGIASAQSGLMLQYDGLTHLYTGEIYSLVVNQQQLDPPLSPIIFNDRALVPAREIFEAVGATVTYTADTQRVEVYDGSTYIRMNINDNVAYVNGEKTAIPDNVVPKLINKVGEDAKTMVPVRFISETIGMDVNFDSSQGSILIESPNYETPQPTLEPIPEPTLEPTPEPVPEPTREPTPEPLPEPTQAPVEKGKIIGVDYQMVSDTQIHITVTADQKIETMSHFTLSDPDRVVVDAANMQMAAGKDNISINKGGISAIRLGDNEERARVVVDVSGLKGYQVQQTADNILLVTVQTNGAPQQPTSKPTQPPQNNPNADASIPDAGAANQSKLIVLDAGHGGSDPGADGTYNGQPVYEKDLTLSITKKVASILQAKGYSIQLTRSGDTYPTLSERSALANSMHAAAFVSIHINSVTGAPSASGTEVYYSTQNNGSAYGATSEQLATNILNGMMKRIDARNRGVKTANHLVTRTSEMPASLVEVGFISNQEEVGKMLTEDYQNKVAEGIAEGIAKTVANISIP